MINMTNKTNVNEHEAIARIFFSHGMRYAMKEGTKNFDECWADYMKIGDSNE